MRPEILFPLYAPLTTLSGVGPKLAKLVEKVAGGEHVVDALWVLPTGIVDRRSRPQIAHATPGKIATIKVQVDEHFKPHTKRLPYKVRVTDDSGGMMLVFFNGREDYLKKQLPVGETRYVSGVVEDYQGVQQMTHPDYILTEDELAEMPLIEPIYPLTAGLTARVMGKAVRGAVALLPSGSGSNSTSPSPVSSGSSGFDGMGLSPPIWMGVAAPTAVPGAMAAMWLE